MKRYTLAILALLLLSIGGCQKEDDPVSAPIDTEEAGETFNWNTLAGTAWELVAFEEIRGGDEVLVSEVPDSATYTLVFNFHWQVGGYAGCEGYAGVYDLEVIGEKIGITLDLHTEPTGPCSTEPMQREFLDRIAGASRVVVSPSDGVLRLYGDASDNQQEVLRFRRLDQYRPDDPPDSLRFVPFADADHQSLLYQLGYNRIAGELPSAAIHGDILLIPVYYPGGCAAHDFTLYADSEAEVICNGNQPCPQTLRLIHTASGPDTCRFISRKPVLQYDLRSLRKRYAEAGITGGTVELTIDARDPLEQSLLVEYRLD